MPCEQVTVPQRTGSICHTVMRIAVIGLVFFVKPVLAQSDFYQDPPSLTEQITTGSLPAIEERLPQTPLIVQPIERLGQHGGIWRLGMKGNNDRAMVYRTIGYEHLVRWDPGWTRVTPNVALSYAVNKNATEFVFRLRPGMKWSDGHPFTADDIMFWYEAVLSNKELTPIPLSHYVVDGKLVEVSKIDDYAVRFKFAAPHGLFLKTLASGRDSGGPVDFPSHWMKRFHKSYNPDGIADEVVKAGAKDWIELFLLKSADDRIPKGLSHLMRQRIKQEFDKKSFEPWPTLNGWIIQGVEEGDPEKIVATRNPYYFKIDPAGKQLPYIDSVQYHTFKGREPIRAMALAGRIGMQARRLTDPKSQSIVTAPGADNNFRLFSLIATETNDLPLALNLSHKDPIKREVFNKLDFRIALSHAIDRATIIKEVYGGVGQPYQVGPRPESRYYHQRLATQYLEYDPAKAAKLLDQIGLKLGNDGKRAGSNGKAVSFKVLVREDFQHKQTALSMIIASWRALGLDVEMEAVPRAKLEVSIQTNSFDATFTVPDGGLQPDLAPQVYMPWSLESAFGIGWVNWFANKYAPDAVEPPDWAKQQMDLYRTLLASGDQDVQANLMRQILEITAKNFPVMGVTLKSERKGVVGTGFHNVPRAIINSWTYPTPAPTNPSQYFVEP
jgi:peptide/nickel transport system substrate-binding protein